MKKGEVVARLLRPTDQQTPKSVHPTVRALDGPTSGAKSRVAADFRNLLAA